MARKKNPAAVELAKLRAKKLSPERRREISQLGGAARAASLNEDKLNIIASRAGLAGGKARAENLTAKQRSEIARKAAAARWAKKRSTE